jgi:hypothetical protein
MAERYAFVPEETPVDDVREIREQRSRETGNDVRALLARSEGEAQAAWDSLVEAKMAFEHDTGRSAQVLRLPIRTAWTLVPRLFREPAFGKTGVIRGGIREIEKRGILGVQVVLIHGDETARSSFE